jgi:hypothetical protein
MQFTSIQKYPIFRVCTIPVISRSEPKLTPALAAGMAFPKAPEISVQAAIIDDRT